MAIEPAIAGLALPASLIIWLRAFDLTLNNHEIAYRTLFGGRRKMRLADVGRLISKIGYTSGDKVTAPFVRLEISPRPHTKAKSLIINAKVFNHKELKTFAELVERRIANENQRNGDSGRVESTASMEADADCES